MEIEMLKGKIHRATVTQAELNYVGSITIDEALLGAAGIREYQKVQVVNINNGNRIETYTIAGEKDSGVICLNGAAARHFSPNDLVIIMAYVSYNEKDLENYSPKVVFVDDKNKIKKISSYEKHGRLS
ncbi:MULTISPECIES: aspartate 1-decarboxylase [Anaerococcus]|uniref:aspartate 1-decarboxylase n=1 Tax=Anaerococcus TaxID=165779 RepID=UPI00242BB96B|nr:MULTISPECIES: aspartate 1-decarboxylase [Anaerococcus]MDD7766459.1 aspartate 1-decarboxylase [Anaerococcus vaginalis]MDY6128048.1 aspartate 1-decarboxylase [Anaerococcus sp.]